MKRYAPGAPSTQVVSRHTNQTSAHPTFVTTNDTFVNGSLLAGRSRLTVEFSPGDGRMKARAQEHCLRPRVALSVPQTGKRAGRPHLV